MDPTKDTGEPDMVNGGVLGGSAVEIRYLDAGENEQIGELDNRAGAGDKFLQFTDGGFNPRRSIASRGNLKVLVREVKYGLTYSSEPSAKGTITRFEIIGGSSATTVRIRPLVARDTVPSSRSPRGRP